MSLIQDRPEGYFFIRACDELSVTVIDRPLTQSCLVLPDQVIEAWPVRTAEEFDEEQAQALLAFDPELVLLGTGTRLQFPSPASRAVLLRQRIGIEVMDNRAACRTYNLLAEEGRRPLLALMLPGR